jgi:hypothetical protein
LGFAFFAGCWLCLQDATSSTKLVIELTRFMVKGRKQKYVDAMLLFGVNV